MSSLNSVNKFSFYRYTFLIKRYLVLYGQKLAIGLFAGLALFILISAAAYLLGEIHTPYKDLIGIFKFTVLSITLGGVFFASHIFDELHKPETAPLFMILPASGREKFLAALVVTSLVYTVMAFAALAILSIMLDLFHLLYFNEWVFASVFNPIGSEVGSPLFKLIVWQSIFLFGGIYFRGYNFLKTILLVLSFSFLMGILSGVFIYHYEPDVLIKFLRHLQTDYKYIFYGVVNLFFWTIGYITFKKRQISS